MDTGQLTWSFGDAVSVRPFQLEEAPAMHRLIQENRAHLDRWLRWSTTVQTEADALAAVELALSRMATGRGFHSGIWVDGELAGGFVCRDLEPEHRSAELGYWLGARFVGRGLATQSSRRAISLLFGPMGLNRVEMQCAAKNVRSRAIPERLGFTLEGIRRQSHWITSEFMDHAIYGLLAREWQDGATDAGGYIQPMSTPAT